MTVNAKKLTNVSDYKISHSSDHRSFIRMSIRDARRVMDRDGALESWFRSVHVYYARRRNRLRLGLSLNGLTAPKSYRVEDYIWNRA